MSTEFAKQRGRRSCLASYSVVSDGSRSVFSYPAGFWQPPLWHDWIVLGAASERERRERGREREGGSVCKVTPSWSCAWVCVPPRECSPLKEKKRFPFSPSLCCLINRILFLLADCLIAEILGLFSTAWNTTDMILITVVIRSRTYPYKLKCYEFGWL